MTHSFHLAEVNLAYMLAPQDDPLMADFVARLDEINALAESSDGFIWRYISDTRDADARELSDPKVLFNMSVWRDVPSLHAFAYRSAHAPVFAARKKWFADWKDRVGQIAELGARAPGTALWWVPADHRPTPTEAVDRLCHLREHGPGPRAFTFRQAFSPTGQPIDR